MYLISAYFDENTNKILKHLQQRIADKTGNDFMIRNNVMPHLTISAIEARNIDVFGFDELEKAMKQCEKNYPSQADAFLMAEGRAVNKRTKSLTPVRTKKLLNSWRTKKVKLYKDGKVRVVRVQSTAPHAHLIELGHKIVSGGRTRERGRKLNRVQRSARGIKSGGYVQGDFMLEKSMSEAQAKFNSGAEKLLDKITKDIQM